MKKYTLIVMSAIALFFTACGGSGNRNDADSTTMDKDTLTVRDKEEKGGAKTWVMDEGASKIKFTITNFGKAVQGTLSGLKGTINFDVNDLKNSHFDAAVKVSTINTGIEKRDKDLMHDKYFDEPLYPEIIYRSDEIVQSGSGYTAHGTLTIRGKTQHQELPFTFEERGGKGIFKSKFTIQRLDYGIGGDGPVMGKDVNVVLEVVATKQ